MVRKMASGLVAGLLLAAMALASGCAGNETGTSEGDGCSNEDQCNSELQCQPVTGHTGSFCCPAPLVLPSGQFSSDKSNCQPVAGK